MVPRDQHRIQSSGPYWVRMTPVFVTTLMQQMLIALEASSYTSSQSRPQIEICISSPTTLSKSFWSRRGDGRSAVLILLTSLILFTPFSPLNHVCNVTKLTPYQRPQNVGHTLFVFSRLSYTYLGISNAFFFLYLPPLKKGDETHRSDLLLLALPVFSHQSLRLWKLLSTCPSSLQAFPFSHSLFLQGSLNLLAQP